MANKVACVIPHKMTTIGTVIDFRLQQSYPVGTDHYFRLLLLTLKSYALIVAKLSIIPQYHQNLRITGIIQVNVS